MRTLFHVLAALLGLFLLAVVAVATWFFAYTSDLPDMSHLGQFAPTTPAVLSDPCLPSPITAIPAGQMGANLRAAIRAAEPEKSWSMQISRSFFCEPQKTLQRDLALLRVDTYLRLRFSSEELLTIYANRMWLGEGASGVQNAAQHYFQKDPGSLSVSEAALLAGLMQAPSYYSPVKHPERALARRNQVLEKMVAQGSLNPAQARAAEAEPLPAR